MLAKSKKLYKLYFFFIKSNQLYNQFEVPVLQNKSILYAKSKESGSRVELLVLDVSIICFCKSGMILILFNSYFCLDQKRNPSSIVFRNMIYLFITTINYCALQGRICSSIVQISIAHLTPTCLRKNPTKLKQCANSANYFVGWLQPAVIVRISRSTGFLSFRALIPRVVFDC